MTAGRALVIGKFLPPHAGHDALIDAAGAAATSVEVVVCDLAGQRPDATLRAAWLREIHPGVHLSVVPDICGWHAPRPCPAACSDRWARHLSELELGPWDVVVTSEEYGPPFAAALGARHVAFDPARADRPVSGTEVRRDLAAAWAGLHPVVRTGLTRKLVVVGAESSGTTTLAADLADALEVACVPEFGRTWSEHLAARAGSIEAVEWTAADFAAIAHGQTRLEEEARARILADDALFGPGGPWLVCDTDLLATSIWHERYLRTAAPDLVARAIADGNRPDFYVLASPAGITFEQDGLRDGCHLRDWMTQRFRAILGETGVDWIEVTGNRSQRQRRVLAALPPIFWT